MISPAYPSKSNRDIKKSKFKKYKYLSNLQKSKYYKENAFNSGWAVEIIKCKDKSFWYKDIIGEIFKPIEEDKLSYKIKTVDLRYKGILTTGSILKEDCRIIADF